MHNLVKIIIHNKIIKKHYNKIYLIKINIKSFKINNIKCNIIKICNIKTN